MITETKWEREKIIIKLFFQDKRFWNRMAMFLNNVGLKDTMTYFEVILLV